MFGRKKEPKTVETKKAVAVDIRARKDAEAEAKRQTLAQTKVEQVSAHCGAPCFIISKHVLLLHNETNLIFCITGCEKG